MRIVAVGDSVTAAQYVDEYDGWPALLARDGWTIAARGVSNDTTRLGLERFPQDVQKLEPDLVLIQFGYNDCNCWQTDRGLPRVHPRAFYWNLHEMVVRARTFRAEPVLLGCHATRKDEAYDRAVAMYDGTIRELAEAQGVRFVDIRAGFPRGIEYLLGDGLHLSVQGHASYASIVAETLRTIEQPKEAAA